MDIRHALSSFKTRTSSNITWPLTKPVTKSSEHLSLWEINCTKFLAVFEQFLSYTRIDRGDL